MPVLNEASGIEACLEALSPLRASGMAEVIVVDGGSHDNTLALSKDLSDLAINAAPGRARQMNAGAAVAQGDYLLFLHADTQLPANLADLVSDWLAANSGWGFFPVALSGRGPLLRCVEWFMNCRSRLSSVATGDQCLFVRRSLFNDLGGFADIPLMEDVEISKRLRKLSAPRVELNTVHTSSRRWEEKGVLRTIFLMWRLRLAYFLGASPEALVRRYYPDYSA